VCGVIVSFFAIIVAVASYLFGAMAIGGIIILIGLLASIGKYSNAKKLQPTPMICPNCHSTNIRISKEVAGFTNSSATSFHGGWGLHSGNVNINRQRLGVCQDCGFDFPYFTEQEIYQYREKTKAHMAIWFLVAFIAALVAVYLFVIPH